MQQDPNPSEHTETVTPASVNILQSSLTDPLCLRARPFPISMAQSLTSVSSSRRPIQRSTKLQSADSINDQSFSGIYLNVRSSTLVDDSLVTAVIPLKKNYGEENNDDDDDNNSNGYMNMDTFPRRDNLGRTQIRVGGYFQGAGDDLVTLIPNDLPRSTVLYVLTASEGRDKFFKCLQYGLQLMMCLLKRPTLFTPESQKFADYWAERFWRNSNTIRHGRMLFKLGRWVLNVFYLQEVIERIALKHGNTLKGFFGSLASTLSYYLYLPSINWLTGYRTQRKLSPSEKGVHVGGGGGDHGKAERRGSIQSEGTYSHVLRGKSPWGESKSSKLMKTLEKKNVKENLNVMTTTLNSTAAMSTYVQDKFHSNMYKTASKEDTKQMNSERNSSHDNNVDKSTALVNFLMPHEMPSSPPSVQSTLPESFMMENTFQYAQGFSTAKLLHPLWMSGVEQDEECKRSSHDITNTNGDGNSDNFRTCSLSHDLLSKQDEPCGTLDTTRDSPCCSLPLSQDLLCELRVGDNLPLPRVCDNVSILHDKEKEQMSRAKTSQAAAGSENEDTCKQPRDALSVSGISFSSGCVSKVRYSEEVGICHEEGISLEMGNPAEWRKHPLQFNTTLMLLLGIRSIATIGRRVLRDILLLLSEKFFNLSYVENNRPMLQRHTNWLWLIVACIDLLLNTIRLLNSGWYKYAKVRHSAQYHCKCNDNVETDTLQRYRGLIARRKIDLFFPSVDLDFGAPICSSPAYFEAADPKHIVPGCRTCGCLFVEGQSGVGSDMPIQPKKQQQPEEKEEKTKQRDLCSKEEEVEESYKRCHGQSVSVSTNTAKTATIGGRAEVVVLLIPYLVRKLLNYLLLLRIHPNWTATVFLQVRYMADLYLAVMYCFGGYETGKSDAPLEKLLHLPGAIAGLLGAIIGLHRVIQSSPS